MNLEQTIAATEEATGLPSAPPHDFIDEVKEVITYERNVLEAMSTDECTYAARTLSRHIFYLANTSARLRARLHYYEIELKKELGRFAEKDFGHVFGTEHKRDTAIMSRKETSDLLNNIQVTKVRLARLDGMIDPIKLLRDDINNIKIAKLSRQKQERE